MSEWSGTCMWRLWSLVAAESRNPQRAWAAEENPLAWNREKREKEDKGRKKVGGQINSLFFSASKSYSFSFVYHYQKKSRRKRGCWCCYRAMKNMCGGCGGCMGQQNFRFRIVESHSSLSFWIQSRISWTINTEKLAIYIRRLFSNELSELVMSHSRCPQPPSKHSRGCKSTSSADVETWRAEPPQACQSRPIRAHWVFRGGLKQSIQTGIRGAAVIDSKS